MPENTQPPAETTPAESTPAENTPTENTAAEGDAATTTNPTGTSTGANPGTEEPMPFYMNPLIWLMAGVWIWLLFSWNKQKKEREERRKAMDAINKGDKVVTIGRLHGEVVKIDEKTITIKPDPKRDLEMTFDRVAVHKAGTFETTSEDGESS